MSNESYACLLDRFARSVRKFVFHSGLSAPTRSSVSSDSESASSIDKVVCRGFFF